MGLLPSSLLNKSRPTLSLRALGHMALQRETPSLFLEAFSSFFFFDYLGVGDRAPKPWKYMSENETGWKLRNNWRRAKGMWERNKVRIRCEREMLRI